MATQYDADISTLVEDDEELPVDFEVADAIPAVKRTVRSSRYDKAFKAAVEADGKPIRLKFPTRKDATVRVQHIRELAARRSDDLSEELGEKVELKVSQRMSDLYITFEHAAG